MGSAASPALVRTPGGAMMDCGAGRRLQMGLTLQPSSHHGLSCYLWSVPERNSRVCNFTTYLDEIWKDLDLICKVLRKGHTLSTHHNVSWVQPRPSEEFEMFGCAYMQRRIWGWTDMYHTIPAISLASWCTGPSARSDISQVLVKVVPVHTSRMATCWTNPHCQ